LLPLVLGCPRGRKHFAVEALSIGVPLAYTNVPFRATAVEQRLKAGRLDAAGIEAAAASATDGVSAVGGHPRER